MRLYRHRAANNNSRARGIMTNPETTPNRCPALPSAWVSTYLPPAKTGDTALDVACGSGRHLKLAWERGYLVTGVDRDTDAISAMQSVAGVTIHACDLENGAPWPFTGKTFQAIIVTNYLYRPQLLAVIASVAPNGILIYETFATGNANFGRPSNPKYLLQPGELLAAVDGRLTPIAYQIATLPNPNRMVQRIAAVGPTHSWLTNPPAPGITT
jgi:SAM-dependent methyltransferase